MTGARPEPARTLRIVTCILVFNFNSLFLNGGQAGVEPSAAALPPSLSTYGRNADFAALAHP
jgi:hypothetical protein